MLSKTTKSKIASPYLVNEWVFVNPFEPNVTNESIMNSNKSLSKPLGEFSICYPKVKKFIIDPF